MPYYSLRRDNPRTVTMSVRFGLTSSSEWVSNPDFQNDWHQKKRETSAVCRSQVQQKQTSAVSRLLLHVHNWMQSSTRREAVLSDKPLAASPLCMNYPLSSVLCVTSHSLLFYVRLPTRFCFMYDYPLSSVLCTTTHSLLFYVRLPTRFCFMYGYPLSSVLCMTTHSLLFNVRLPTLFCFMYDYPLSFCFMYDYRLSSVLCMTTHSLLFYVWLATRFCCMYDKTLASVLYVTSHSLLFYVRLSTRFWAVGYAITCFLKLPILCE
jgi:hypothetical protein